MYVCRKKNICLCVKREKKKFKCPYLAFFGNTVNKGISSPVANFFKKTRKILKKKKTVSQSRFSSQTRVVESENMSARGAKQFAKVGLPVVLFCCGGMLMLKQVRNFVCLFSLSHFFRTSREKNVRRHAVHRREVGASGSTYEESIGKRS